jgi:hypothetical protein
MNTGPHPANMPAAQVGRSGRVRRLPEVLVNIKCQPFGTVEPFRKDFEFLQRTFGAAYRTDQRKSPLHLFV